MFAIFLAEIACLMLFTDASYSEAPIYIIIYIIVLYIYICIHYHIVSFHTVSLHGISYHIISYHIIEGSLEVKLPTIWTVEKQR